MPVGVGAWSRAMLTGTTCWVLTDGKIGDLVQCLGVAEHLGLAVEQRIVAPRRPWSWLAPHGPPDPREAVGQPDGPLRPPFPAIAIASGRRAVPPLRALKRGSPATFTVFLKQPTTGPDMADLIWVPEHDGLRGANVIVTLTSPSRLTDAKLAEARKAPHPRIAALPHPRVAMLLGGPNGRYRYDHTTVDRLVEIADTVLQSGRSLMVTPSRRTPPALVAALAGACPTSSDRLFIWDGHGPNPYLSMLALAEALVVTADSANMMGEAALTGMPIHVVEPAGGHPKLRRFLDRLIEHGAARRWSGRLESFTYAPLDATPVIAAAVEARFRAHRDRLARGPAGSY